MSVPNIAVLRERAATIIARASSGQMRAMLAGICAAKNTGDPLPADSTGQELITQCQGIIDQAESDALAIFVRELMEFVENASTGGDMGCCDQVAEILSILQGSGTGAPVFTGTLPPGDETSIYQGQIQARGVLPIAFSVISGSLPTGTSLNSSTGLIIGNPIGGNYDFTIRATNSAGTSTQEYSVAIVGIAPLFTYDSQSALFGAINNSNCSVSGTGPAIPYTEVAPVGENPSSYLGTPPITWTIEQGAAQEPAANFVAGIPDGLSINSSTGALSGFPNNAAQIPSTGFGDFGIFSLKVRGTNAWGTSVYSSVRLAVLPEGSPIQP